jgi:hypothetical protein
MIERLGALRVVVDTSPADWVLEQLAPWRLDGRWIRVRSMVPGGYEGYGRLLHPAGTLHADGTTFGPVRWADLAQRRGIELRADTTFRSIGWADPSGERVDDAGLVAGVHAEPADGDMESGELAVLATFLTDWTSTPDMVWCCVWEGYGWRELPRQFEGPPRVRLEHRDCLLCTGTMADVCSLPGGWAPTMWWPEDRAWCVRTDIDGCSTYLAASAACISALTSLTTLEGIPVDADDDFVGI